MFRRTGQSGHIESSGRWWVVRWWMDVPGIEKRKHMRERICPISGPGSVSKTVRERRAREIITQSGADTVEYFNEVVKQKNGVTFRRTSEMVAQPRPKSEAQAHCNFDFGTLGGLS